MKKLIVIIIVLLIIGGYLIKSSFNLKFDNNSDKASFTKLFSSWTVKLFINIKSITTYAVKQDWSTPNPNSTKND